MQWCGIAPLYLGWGWGEPMPSILTTVLVPLRICWPNFFLGFPLIIEKDISLVSFAGIQKMCCACMCACTHALTCDPLIVCLQHPICTAVHSLYYNSGKIKNSVAHCSPFEVLLYWIKISFNCLYLGIGRVIIIIGCHQSLLIMGVNPLCPTEEKQQQQINAQINK